MKLVRGLVGLVLLMALGVGAALGIRWLARWIFEGVDPTVSAAMVAAVATVLVSVLSVVLARVFERRQRIELEIRERKVPVYQEMVEGLLGGLLESAESGDTTKLEELFKRLTPNLVTWGSDDVIRSWNAFKQRSVSEPEGSISVMLTFEAVLKALRRDLGHKRDGLATGDLLGLFINDIGDHLPQSTK